MFKNGSSNIYLIGFMGVGKSTVGPVLAQYLGFSFLDTDTLIENQTRMKVSSVFKEKGEEYFRDLESKVIRYISRSSHSVFSLGGGVILRKENRQILQDTGQTIYLRASPQTLFSRLKKTLKNRPLLSHLSEEEMMTEIQRILAKRQSLYEEADLQVDTDEKTVNEVVSEIMSCVSYTKYESRIFI